MSMLTDLRTYLLTPPPDVAVAPMTEEMRTALLLIQSKVGTRIYPDELDEAKPLPALVYQMVTDKQGHLLNGQNDGLNETRVQVDVFSLSATERDDLGEAVQTALDAYVCGTIGSSYMAGIFWDNSLNSFESERRQYRKIIDFKVHYEG